MVMQQALLGLGGVIVFMSCGHSCRHVSVFVLSGVVLTGLRVAPLTWLGTLRWKPGARMLGGVGLAGLSPGGACRGARSVWPSVVGDVDLGRVRGSCWASWALPHRLHQVNVLVGPGMVVSCHAFL